MTKGFSIFVLARDPSQVYCRLIDAGQHGLPQGYQLSARLPTPRHGHNVKILPQCYSPITVFRISHSCTTHLNKQTPFVCAAEMPGLSAIRGAARISAPTSPRAPDTGGRRSLFKHGCDWLRPSRRIVILTTDSPPAIGLRLPTSKYLPIVEKLSHQPLKVGLVPNRHVPTLTLLFKLVLHPCQIRKPPSNGLE